MIASLFDHLWQSTLFAAAVGLLTTVLAAKSAVIRFWLWFAASVKFLMPFSALTALGAYLFQSFAPKATPPIFFDLQPAAEPFSGAAPVLAPAIAHGIDWSPLLLGLWALGFAVISAIWLGRWLKLRTILAAASPLLMDAPMQVKSSDALLEPGLVGIWRPVLLLPRGIDARLSQPEMRAILAHEHCHLRRHDNLLAAIHMAVEALFWFHPLVWWLGTRLIAERENACDEAVLASGSDPQTYAEGILKVCRFYMHSPLDCASGVSGADLKKRMEMIMDNKFAIRLRTWEKTMLAACAATAIAAPLALGLLTAPPAVAPAMAQTPDAPHPGTEAALRRQIEGWEKKQPALGELAGGLAVGTTQDQAAIQKQFDGLGALKAITFKENFTGGGDVYLVEFTHGSLAWMIMPPVDGKIRAMSYQPILVRTDNGPSPGVEAMVRRYYDGFLKGAPAYDIMTPALYRTTRRLMGFQEPDAKNLGALKTLAFIKINAAGSDVYAATFDNGTSTFTAQPLTDGLLNNIQWFDVHLPSAPAHPGTEASLRRYIESLEKGQPNYVEMVPGMADQVKQQLAERLAVIKSWGELESIAFKGGGSSGRDDVYDVTFKNGKSECSIAPLNTAGMVVFRECWPVF